MINTKYNCTVGATTATLYTDIKDNSTAVGTIQHTAPAVNTVTKVSDTFNISSTAAYAYVIRFYSTAACNITLSNIYINVAVNTDSISANGNNTTIMLPSITIPR
jgi:hypothetical protein